jgi:hypothetical protein
MSLQDEIHQNCKRSVARRDWVVKLDLKDAYLSVPIHQVHAEFLQISVSSWRFYHLASAVLQCSSALYVFQEIRHETSSLSQQYASCDQDQDRNGTASGNCWKLLVSLGFIINVKKSVLDLLPTPEAGIFGFALGHLNVAWPSFFP